MGRLAKLVVGGVLAISLLGCGRGGGAIATGVVAGAAIGAMAAAAANPPSPEPHYYPTYYVQAQPPVVYGPVDPRTQPQRTDDDDLPRFDAAAARATLAAVDVTPCGGPPGQGHARVTLNPDGVISRVQVEDPANLEPQVAECVGRLLGRATVAPFRGSLVVVGISFRLN